MFFEAVKLRVEDRIYYPDLMVVCTPVSGDAVVVHDPCLIVEVTCPGTALTDRREKLAAYKRVPMLRTYLIVDQRRRRVAHHWRDETGAWWRSDLSGDGTAALACPMSRSPSTTSTTGSTCRR